MSKIVNVENGGYSLRVQPGQDIILDTTRGTAQSGNVVVKGNLEVGGSTFNITSTDVNLIDNVITVNYDPDNAAINGIPASKNYVAGLTVARGTAPEGRFWWNDQTMVTMNGLNLQGAFEFTRQDLGYTPVVIKSIHSQGTLYLNTGNGVISVQDSNSYEDNVYNYNQDKTAIVEAYNEDTGETTTYKHPDLIPNAKGVADFVEYVLAAQGTNLISDVDTNIEARDFSTTGSVSDITFVVDGTEVMNANLTAVTINDVVISNNTIKSQTQSDLILGSPGDSSVRIDDSLIINETPGENTNSTDPLAPNEGIKLYSKTEDIGKTGLFFVNKDNNRDEIVSKNRALLFGMLF